jgi:outer membrane receptor protein involved in Fe transport
VTDGIYNSLNVDRVVHSGVEIASTYKFTDKISLTSNFAFNHNRVKEFVTTIYTLDYMDSDEVDFSGKKVSRYPEILANFIADYNSDRYRFTFYGNYIGKQYSDLYNIEKLAIKPVFVSSVAAEVKLGNFLGMGNLLFSTRIDNLFSKKYESAVAYAENYVTAGGDVEGWSTYYVASELSFFSQLKVELF